MSDARAPKRLRRAAERIERHAGGPIEIAIVLGSGLADAVLERIAGRDVPYGKLDVPHLPLAGHAAFARIGSLHGRRVAAFAGRAHLYQGFSAGDVTYPVRVAAAAGARAIVLTNAAGGLNAGFARGALMLITDHLNLTGTSPLDGTTRDPFLNTTDLYAPRLRALARKSGSFTVDGVYAGLRGPQYETAAECEALRRLGADAVGMSTVLEALAARSLGLEVAGISVITNVIGSHNDASHAEVLAQARESGARVADLVGAIVEAP